MGSGLWECYRMGNLLFCHILYCISSTLGTTVSSHHLCDSVVPKS
ncbi:unnamed protein product [Oikopleura dioica]|uniref:Uncharacterized protein n=1 Tax=Oikopleura dioica TaxID=34765 RepID=E4WQC6_OIKDI|nr:unnamed protein product [Oikopleura dioica]